MPRAKQEPLIETQPQENSTSRFAMVRKDGLWQGIQFDHIDGKYEEVARSPGDMKVMALSWIENRMIMQSEDM